MESAERIRQHIEANRFSRTLRSAPFYAEIERIKSETRRPARTCRWCGKKVPPPRRSWCSDACVDEMRLRSDPSIARCRVFNRDHGVCSKCGLDTVASEARYRMLFRDVVGSRGDIGSFYAIFGVCRRYRWAPGGYGRIYTGRPGSRRIIACRCPACRPTIAVTWEADHIIPVAEGGGCCGLENLRTLCRDCHEAETAALRRRLRKGG